MFQQRFVRENQRQRLPSPARRSRLGDMQILLDAVADARRGRHHGITGKVSVPGGRLHLGVTEQFSNHGQTLTVNGGEIMYRRGGVKMYHGLGGSLSA